MVFWLSLNCQNYLSYCSENGHFSPRYFFWQMFSPLKSTKTPLNPWKTWALFCWPKPDTAAWQWWKNRKHTWIGIAQLSCSCFWAMFELFCSHSAAILQLFCNSFAAILQLFCDSFEAILQIFCSYFEAICQGFDLDLPCFFLFSKGFYKVWVGTSWVSTRISLGSLWVWKIKKNHHKPYGKQLYDLHVLFVSRIAFLRSPRATSHDWCRKELDPIKITRKPAVFLTKRVRCFQSPIFYVCQSAGDWLGHCVLCGNVMMHRAHVHIYTYIYT